MKKLFMFIFMVTIFFGLVACPSADDPAPNTVTSNTITKSGGVSATSGDDTSGDDKLFTIPEPSTIILLGSGLIGIVGFGRNNFFKK